MQLEWLYLVGAIVLAAALYYGAAMGRNRNRRNDKVTDAAVKEQYAKPDDYAPETFREQLKPDPDTPKTKAD